jgi:2-isopropylmalate synthase
LVSDPQRFEPELDFSDINAVAEECTSFAVHPRHPYIGDLVFTAFSGSHQSAIKKGLAVQDKQGIWQVPYLPIDPSDLGRTYDGVIRVNSQSGKGGIAFLLEREQGIVMPRRMQVEFSSIVQRHADASESEINGAELWRLFGKTYFRGIAGQSDHIVYINHAVFDGGQGIELELIVRGSRQILRGQGNGPIAAAVDALGISLRVDSYEEKAMGGGVSANALAIVEAAVLDRPAIRFGVGVSSNIVTAAVLAVVSAANRLMDA